jgi:hypothetical protein
MEYDTRVMNSTSVTVNVEGLTMDEQRLLRRQITDASFLGQETNNYDSLEEADEELRLLLEEF